PGPPGGSGRAWGSSRRRLSRRPGARRPGQREPGGWCGFGWAGGAWPRLSLDLLGEAGGDRRPLGRGGLDGEGDRSGREVEVGGEVAGGEQLQLDALSLPKRGAHGRVGPVDGLLAAAFREEG